MSAVSAFQGATVAVAYAIEAAAVLIVALASCEAIVRAFLAQLRDLTSSTAETGGVAPEAARLRLGRWPGADARRRHSAHGRRSDLGGDRAARGDRRAADHAELLPSSGNRACGKTAERPVELSVNHENSPRLDKC